MDTGIIILTATGMLIDTIILFFYLNCYTINDKRKIFAVVAYTSYFAINFILGCTDIDLWIRTLVNISLIICIGHIVYENMNSYEVGKEAIIYILLVAVAEFLFIPVVFLFTNNFSADIFNDPTRPYLWLVSMGFSRMIAMCLFRGYRKINKQSYKSLDKQEVVILYLPLIISFICFLIILRTVLDIDNFEKEHFSILLVAFACTLVIYTLIHMIFYERYIHYRNENQELLMLKQKDALKYEYYRNRIESYENMRILYHDLKNHILVSNYDSSYLEKAKVAILKFEKVFDTGCDILNILLWEKNNEAEKMDIGFECVVDNVDLSFMDDMDVSALFGNMLDNAIESAEKQQEKQKRLIWLYVTREKQFVRIRTENYCDEKIHFKNGMPVTMKKDRRLHGYGMKSIKSTVEKYHGSVVAAQENNWFELKILLPAGR